MCDEYDKHPAEIVFRLLVFSGLRTFIYYDEKRKVLWPPIIVAVSRLNVEPFRSRNSILFSSTKVAGVPYGVPGM